MVKALEFVISCPVDQVLPPPLYSVYGLPPLVRVASSKQESDPEVFDVFEIRTPVYAEPLRD